MCVPRTDVVLCKDVTSTRQLAQSDHRDWDKGGSTFAAVLITTNFQEYHVSTELYVCLRVRPAVFCPPPAAPPHGRLSPLTNMTFPADTLLNLTCNLGYGVVNGSAYVRCFLNETTSQLGACERKFCLLHLTLERPPFCPSVTM